MADQSKDQTKVKQLRPLAEGLNLTVKVLNSKTIRGGVGRQGRLDECLVGDDTGIIVFTARNDTVDLMKEGATVNLVNAKIEMFKGSMRLTVDRSGRVEAAAEPADFTVNKDINLSLIEFERIDVVL